MYLSNPAALGTGEGSPGQELWGSEGIYARYRPEFPSTKNHPLEIWDQTPTPCPQAALGVCSLQSQ